MRFKHEVKNSDWNSQNWAGRRSNVTCSHHYLFNVWEPFFWSYFLMGDKAGGATDIDRFLASWGLPTPIFTSIGNDDFWSCPTDFMPTLSRPKMIILLSCISRRDRVGFPYEPLSAFWMAELVPGSIFLGDNCEYWAIDTYNIHRSLREPHFT